MSSLFGKRYLLEGQLASKWYGFAYEQYDRRRTVIYPVPLNVVVAWGRKVWITLRHNKTYEVGYDRGYAIGYEKGREYGFYMAYNQTLRHELKTIVDNFDEALSEVLAMKFNDPKANGWQRRFIDREEKRLIKRGRSS